MSSRVRGIASILGGLFAALIVMSAALPSAGAKESWDHVANIKDAAKRLAVLHEREGSAGVLKFLDACYRTQMLASEYSQGLESCLAQDYMHSQVLAQIYAQIPQEKRVQMGTPSPEEIARSMGARFVAVFQQYKISNKQAEALKTMVEKNGMPIFLKAVFPPKKNGDANSDSGSDTAGGR